MVYSGESILNSDNIRERLLYFARKEFVSVRCHFFWYTMICEDISKQQKYHFVGVDCFCCWDYIGVFGQSVNNYHNHIISV